MRNGGLHELGTGFVKIPQLKISASLPQCPSSKACLDEAGAAEVPGILNILPRIARASRAGMIQPEQKADRSVLNFWSCTRFFIFSFF
jgi:hypothetical protein